MNEYIFLMHGDVQDQAIANNGERWEQYLSALRASGCFDGGSSIGPGKRFKHHCADQSATGDVTGYFRVRAETLAGARRFLVGNPTYEAGGTVEVRVLLRD
ncbi:MAG TPA: hypothetical protein VGC21_09170 [Telluria sp.]|jgi:hypothetical protein